MMVVSMNRGRVTSAQADSYVVGAARKFPSHPFGGYHFFKKIQNFSRESANVDLEPNKTGLLVDDVGKIRVKICHSDQLLLRQVRTSWHRLWLQVSRVVPKSLAFAGGIRA